MNLLSILQAAGLLPRKRRLSDGNLRAMQVVERRRRNWDKSGTFRWLTPKPINAGAMRAKARKAAKAAFLEGLR